MTKLFNIVLSNKKNLEIFEPIKCSMPLNQGISKEWLDFLNSYGGIVSKKTGFNIIGLNMPIEYYIALENKIYQIEQLSQYTDMFSDSRIISFFIRSYNIIGFNDRTEDLLFYNPFSNNELVLWNIFEESVRTYNSLNQTLEQLL